MPGRKLLREVHGGRGLRGFRPVGEGPDGTPPPTVRFFMLSCFLGPWVISPFLIESRSIAMPHWREKMLSRACAVFSLALVFCIAACAESELISFGGVELRLGTSKKEVQERFPSEEYICDWEKDSVLVVTRERFLGILTFSDGRLVQVSKTWHTTSGAEAIKLVGALHDLLAAMTESEHGLQATVVARTRSEPGHKQQFVDVVFGTHRSVRLSIQEGTIVGRPFRKVSVQECFGSCVVFSRSRQR